MTANSIVYKYQQSLFRLLTLAATVFLLFSMPYRKILLVLWPILIPHYFMAIYYTFPRFRRSFKKSKSFYALFVLNALWVFLTFMYYQGYDLVFELYFGIHHALTEAYVFRSNLIKKEHKSLNLEKYFSIRIIFSLLSFIFITQGNILVLLPIYAICTVALFYLNFRNLKNNSIFSDMVFFDTIEVLVVLACLFSASKIHVEYLIFYHVVIWFFFASNRIIQSQSNWRRPLANFLTGVVIMTGFGVLCTSTFPVFAELEKEFLSVTAISGAFLHITLTFVTSESNPAFLRKWLN